MRNRAQRGVLAAIGGVALSLLGAASAQADVTCLYDAGTFTVNVTLTAADDSATLAVSGTSIGLDGVACGEATVVNTDLIQVNAETPIDLEDQSLTIDLAGGLFEPGVEVEPDGSSEIEWSIDLGAGEDSMAVSGSEGDEEIVVGTEGINLNAGEDFGTADPDVTLVGIEFLSLDGFGGDDWIDGAGAFGTGDGYPLPLNLSGGPGIDFLHGGLAAELVSGGAGDDLLSGADGDDELVGGPGEDSIFGGGGDDSLIGGSGSDWLIGGMGADSMSGGYGNDGFDEGQDPYEAVADDAGDVMAGGSGFDVVSYLDRTGGVRISNNGIANDGYDGELDSIGSDVEDLWGTDRDDVIVGNDRSNELRGFDGDDRIYGRGGHDRMHGGDMGDRLWGGEGEDRAFGGSGEDQIRAGDGDDLLEGYNGRDSLWGGEGADVLRGQVGFDLLYGEGGRDVLDARDGKRDALDGGVGRDRCMSDQRDRVASCERA